MTDIFISYARSDRKRIEALVEIFKDQAYSVWWDTNIVPGSSFEAVIDEAIINSRLVLVIWTENSIHSEWVQAEASDGLERGILIPVMLDEVRVPIAFRRRQAIRLIGWPKSKDQYELNRLLKVTAEMLRGTDSGIDADHVTDSVPEPESEPVVSRWFKKGPKKSTGYFIGLASLMLFIVIILKFSPLKTGEEYSPDSANPISPQASISVIPFVASDEIAESFQGLSFEIADLLRRADALQVSSEAQINTYLSQMLSGFRSRLDSKYVLSGTFTASPGGAAQLNLVLQLASSSEPLWTHDYLLSADINPDITRTIAEDVAANFNINLPVEEGDIKSSSYLKYLKAQMKLREPKSLAGLIHTKSMFEEVVSEEPKFGVAYAGLCQTELLLYQETQTVAAFKSAEKNCYHANRLDTHNSHVYLALGVLYRESGKLDESLDSLRSALEASPFSTAIMRALSQTLAGQGKYTDAEKHLLVALEIEPSYWLNYREMGRLSYVQSEYEKAAHYYQLESELVSDNSRALNNLGAAYFLAEHFEQAIKAWEGTENLNQNDRTLANLGSAYFFKREFSSAAEMYIKALEIAPEKHEYWGGLGEAVSYSGEGDYKKHYRRALKLAESKLAINPNDPMLLSILSTYYAVLGNSEKSLGIIKRLNRMNIQDVYVVYDIARASIRLGDDASAKKYVKQLINMGYSENLLSLDANFDEITRK